MNSATQQPAPASLAHTPYLYTVITSDPHMGTTEGRRFGVQRPKLSTLWFDWKQEAQSVADILNSHADLHAQLDSAQRTAISDRRRIAALVARVQELEGALRLIANSDSFNGGPYKGELVQIARAMLAKGDKP